MYNLITTLNSIDPNEVEGLLARFGLHPTVLAVVLYVVAIINVLIPVLGPFIYRVFGNKINDIKVLFNSFKGEFLTRVEKLEGTYNKIDASLNTIAGVVDVVETVGAKVDITLDLLFVVLENSRIPDETKEKVREAKALREVKDRELKRLVEEQSQNIANLQKEISELKERNSKAPEVTRLKKKR